MTDRELLAVILDWMRHPFYYPPTRMAMAEVIEREIRLRETRFEAARYVVRVDQVVPFVVGECGQGDDHRLVQSSLTLAAGDQLVVQRVKPELVLMGPFGALVPCSGCGKPLNEGAGEGMARCGGGCGRGM